MLREKICGRFRYPMELNVEQYMSKDAPKYNPDAYRYQLVGVVVHSGTAEVGHYYSFIKVFRDYFSS